MVLIAAVAVVVVAVDHAAKAAVVARLAEGAATSRTFCHLRLCHLRNQRRPWHSTSAVRVMALALCLLLVVAGALASILPNRAAHVAIGAMLGGAAGNVIDAAARGGITDFIDLRVWPVFNLADVAIVAGATLAVWSALLPAQ